MSIIKGIQCHLCITRAHDCGLWDHHQFTNRLISTFALRGLPNFILYRTSTTSGYFSHFYWCKFNSSGGQNTKITINVHVYVSILYVPWDWHAVNMNTVIKVSAPDTNSRLHNMKGNRKKLAWTQGAMEKLVFSRRWHVKRRNWLARSLWLTTVCSASALSRVHTVANWVESILCTLSVHWSGGQRCSSSNHRLAWCRASQIRTAQWKKRAAALRSYASIDTTDTTLHSGEST